MSLKRLLVIFGYVMIFRGEVVGNTGHCPNIKTSLSSVRKKRYLTFPDDSSASITKEGRPICLLITSHPQDLQLFRDSLAIVPKYRKLTNKKITIDLAKTFQTHVPSGWYVTMDLDVIFPLPDSKFTIEHSRKKLHHRQKRDLWERIEEAVGIYNVNGRSCILRSICEAKVHLAPKGKSLIHDVLRAIFTIPSFEAEFEEEMREGYDDVLVPEICNRIHDCPFSLLHFILDMNRPR